MTPQTLFLSSVQKELEPERLAVNVSVKVGRERYARSA